MRRRRHLRRILAPPFAAWLALCSLLAVTCTLAYVPLGGWNLAVSLAIASLKAAIVGLVFMRLSKPDAISRLAAAAGPIWLVIMALLIGADYLTR